MSFRLEIHNEGFAEVRKSPAIQAQLHAMGERIASAAGGGGDFEVIDSPGRDRARVVVVTATAEGKRAEAEDRALTRALDAGRG